MNYFNSLVSTLSLSVCMSTAVFAQTTGSFNKEIMVDGVTRNVEYAVPDSYDANNTYGLLIALQGCGNANMPAGYRDQLEFMNNDYNLIVAAPVGLADFYYKMDDSDSTIISKTIQDALSTYNINEGHVFLTGFSCNGYVTAKYGTYSTIYPFAGIIPYNAGISFDEINNGDFNLETDVPTCICIGSLDSRLGENQALADSISNNGGSVLLNEMPGVGHTIAHASFKTEVSECMTWFNNQLPPLSTVEQNGTNDVVIWKNTKGKSLSFELKEPINKGLLSVYDVHGRLLTTQLVSEQQNTIDFNGFSAGTLFVALRTNTTHKPVVHKFIVE